MSDETAAPETIATTLAGAGDAPVENLSTTQDITSAAEPAMGIVAEPENHLPLKNDALFDALSSGGTTYVSEPPTSCYGCAIHDVQFVTRAGVTTLRCKICDAEVDPADDGEADTLAAYNKDVDKSAVK